MLSHEVPPGPFFTVRKDFVYYSLPHSHFSSLPKFKSFLAFTYKFSPFFAPLLTYSLNFRIHSQPFFTYHFTYILLTFFQPSLAAHFSISCFSHLFIFSLTTPYAISHAFWPLFVLCILTSTFITLRQFHFIHFLIHYSSFPLKIYLVSLL